MVTDVRLPDGTGLDLVRGLREQDDAVGIVVLTMYAGDEQLFAALEAGASAFVAKDAAGRRRGRRRPARIGLAAVVHRRQPRGRHAPQDVAHRPAALPPETDVLRLLAEGQGVSAIARTLFVSESTAKTHISKIYEKLGAANRAQAIMNAIRAGLLTGAERI